MPWCHTCRVEYRPPSSRCPECGGNLVDFPAPERRVLGSDLVVVATLPAEQAFAASGRLDARGITTALRSAPSDAADVLVPPSDATEARSILLRGRDGHTHTMLVMLLIAAIALFLSGAMLVARWFLNGSPLPR